MISPSRAKRLAKLERIRPEIGKLKADALVVSDPARGGLDLQYPRLRRRTHAAAARFRHRAARGPPCPLCRRPQARQRGAPPARRRSPICASRPAFASDLAALGARRRLCASIRPPPPTRWRVCHQPRRQGRARRRPDRADEGGEEPGRDRGRARGAPARRRRRGALSRLVRSRGAGGRLTEIEAVEALESFRRDTGKLKDVSFPTIAGAGPAAPSCITGSPARPTGRSRPELFLSIPAPNTKTAPPTSPARSRSATPSEEMRERFTLVLKGHIAIARAVFPDGTTGAQLDPLRAAIPVAGRPRFRPRHRPRRRQLSVGA